MTDTVNTRELILSILLQVDSRQEYSHIAIREVLEKYQYLPKQERKFITRVSEGTIENQIQIDYILNQFSKVKVKKMKPVIRAILRSGVYQLKFMNSVPASAACNEAVKLAEKKGFRNLKGFVNGVLRSISRNLEQIEYPDEKKEPVKALSVAYSMPEWIILQWQKAYGEAQTKAILEAFQTERPTTIRVNTLRIGPQELKSRLEKQGLNVKEDSEFNTCLYLSGYDTLTQIPEFEEGLFSVQDKSSMQVAQIADPNPGDYCIDVCAAPGGKSMHVAEKLNQTGMVDARDLTEYKVELIEENMQRCQIEHMTAKVWDARILDTDCVEKADLVLADLPCSGLGVLGRKTDIRYRMSEEQEKELAALQREILNTVWQYVKLGGTLLYSTCTIDRMENEDNVEWFLQTHPEFTLEKMQQILPDSAGNDGFFIAKMKRNSKAE
ncbi:MAG: 16S rRNA (cytosine(967)-C(5))-methyltransferase RsmB [Lachnospiraceae bacterium]